MQRAVDSVKLKEPKRFEKKPYKKPFHKENKEENSNVKEEKKVKESAKEEGKQDKKVEVKEVKEEKAAETDLSKMTVSQLRELAKEKDIKGYSTMKKAELLDALK